MKKISFPKYVVILICVLVISVGSYTGWKIWKNVMINQEASLSWRTLKDEKYKFELQYPTDWKIKSPSDYGYISFYNPKFTNPDKNWSNGFELRNSKHRVFLRQTKHRSQKVIFGLS